MASAARLLERDHLLTELEQLLEEAAVGHGSLALVAGEAGAGKSALVHAFTDQLTSTAARERNRTPTQGAVVLKGSCDPLTTPRPLSPLLDIAADPRSGLDQLDARADPQEMFATLLRRLKNARPVVVLVIEDIHWADGGTLDFLTFIGRRVSDVNALVVATYRDDEVTGMHPTRLVVGDLATRRSTRQVAVPPLSVDAVAQLSGYGPSMAERLHKVTGGNAFYVTEVVANADEIPETVRGAVLARVQRLGHGARAVVEAVAAAPRDLELDYALLVSGATLSDVDEAAATGVLLGTEGRLRFRHEIARAAVENVTPLGRQIHLHRAIIDILLAHQPDDLARIAHHAGLAHAWELVVKYAPEAARQASLRGSHREATQFLKLALARSEYLEPTAKAELLVALTRELAILDRYAEALEASREAVALRRGLGDPYALSAALCQLSDMLFRTSHNEASSGAVAEALTLLDENAPVEAQIRAYNSAATVSMLLRHYQTAIDAGERALRLARSIGSDTWVAQVTTIIGAAELVMGDTARGVDLVREAGRLSQAAGSDRAYELALWMMGSGAGEGRAYAASIEALSEQVEIALSKDDDAAVAYGRAWLARVAFEQGRWDDAISFADLVQPRQGRGVIGPITSLGAKGRVQVRRGDPQATATLEAALTAGSGAALQYVWSPLCGLAEHAWLEGETEAIPALLSQVRAEALAADSPWARGEIALWLWEAGARDAATEGMAPPYRALLSGDWRAAADLWAAYGCPYEKAFALSHGDEEALLRALAIFHELGAQPMAARLRSRLRALGIEGVPRGPRAETKGNPAGLTSRQLDVIKLVAAGLSNGQIAEKLFISERTVEHHVSAILEKLGGGSRASAVAKALAMNIVNAENAD